MSPALILFGRWWRVALIAAPSAGLSCSSHRYGCHGRGIWLARRDWRPPAPVPVSPSIKAPCGRQTVPAGKPAQRPGPTESIACKR
jgi:hypothetical protein